MTLVNVMLCVRNENGNPTGKVEGIDVYAGGADNLLQLRGQPLNCHVWEQLSNEGRSIKIGHMGLWAKSYQEYVGNIFWDTARVQVREAIRIINYVRRRGWFCELGYAHLYDKFDAGQDITVGDLERAVGETKLDERLVQGQAVAS